MEKVNLSNAYLLSLRPCEMDMTDGILIFGLHRDSWDLDGDENYLVVFDCRGITDGLYHLYTDNLLEWRNIYYTMLNCYQLTCVPSVYKYDRYSGHATIQQVWYNNNQFVFD